MDWIRHQIITRIAKEHGLVLGLTNGGEGSVYYVNDGVVKTDEVNPRFITEGSAIKVMYHFQESQSWACVETIELAEPESLDKLHKLFQKIHDHIDKYVDENYIRVS